MMNDRKLPQKGLDFVQYAQKTYYFFGMIIITRY
jgi:hypothetical protein